MTRFIDQYRSAYGVEPICEVLPIALATNYERLRRWANPETAPPRVKHDIQLSAEIQGVFEESI